MSEQTEVVEQEAPRSFMDSVRTDFKQDATFEVPLSNGTKVVFRSIRKRQEMQEIIKKGKTLFKNTQGDAAPKKWRPFLPITPEIALEIAYVSTLSVDPHLSHLDCLELVKDYANVWALLYGSIMERVSLVVGETETEEWEETGED